VRKIKIIIASTFIAAVIGALAAEAVGYPPFLAKARKFGAKDCTFCHVDPAGGPPWNEVGQWLINEKERRKADAVDVEWLADYKKDAGKKNDEGKKADDKAAAPAAQPSQAPAPAKVDPKVYDNYVGQYDTSFGPLNITREGDKLYGQPEGESKEELVPESETVFNVPTVGAKVTFVKDENGKVTHLLINIQGQEMKAKKVK